MVLNNICEKCDKAAVCKIINILAKFYDDAKKPLGVDITIDKCSHCAVDSESDIGESNE